MKNRLFAVLLSILFACGGAIPWIVLGYFGWTASIAGFLIGLAAYKGYIIGNGTFDSFGKKVLVVVILLIVPAAEMFNFFLSAFRYDVSFIDALTYTPSLFIENLGDFLPAILIGYLLAFLGVWQFLKLPSDVKTAETLPVEEETNNTESKL